jgi:hypothetical protein
MMRGNDGKQDGNNEGVGERDDEDDREHLQPHEQLLVGWIVGGTTTLEREQELVPQHPNPTTVSILTGWIGC